MIKTAKAMVFNKVGEPLLLQEFEIPKLKKGEVLVKIKNCTLCKSDLHTFLGRRSGPTPSVLGHEIVGEIYELPTNETIFDYNGKQLKTGDLVTWGLAVFCGKCRNCAKGFPQKCDHLKKYGHLQIDDEHQFNGGLAEFIHLKPGTAIFKLKPGIPIPFLSPLNCSFSTVVAALRTARNIENRNVIIFGAGMLGVLSVAMLQVWKANKITVIDPSSTRLKIAKKFGADQVLQWNKKKTSTLEFSQDQLNQEKFDVILETSGSSQAINSTKQILGIGGQIILIGSVFPTEDIKINPEMILRNLWQIKGLHNYHPDDLKTAIDFYYQSFENYPFELLFSNEHFALEDSEKAMSLVETSRVHRVVMENNTH